VGSDDPRRCREPAVVEEISEDNLAFDAGSETRLDERGYDQDLLKHFRKLVVCLPALRKRHRAGRFPAEEAPSPTETQSYHVRERPAGNFNGITQQAALAIQNDRLQSEVVERERLNVKCSSHVHPSVHFYLSSCRLPRTGILMYAGEQRARWEETFMTF